MTYLPKPDFPHPDWARLLKAIWDHGRDFPNPDYIQNFLGARALSESLAQTTERRDGPAFVRPSNLLSCARQPWLLLQGNEPEALSTGLAASFAIGHLVEAFTRAYLLSALPPGFGLTYDTRVPLPSWWPADHAQFADLGTNDFTITVDDRALAADYIDLDRAAQSCVFDLKTAGMQPYNQFQRAKSLIEKPDGFGYLAQITVYGAGYEEANGRECDVALMVFNRNSPMQGVAVRGLGRGQRAMEESRLRAAIEAALAGTDPGLEFAERWGGEGAFYCKSYCALRHACQATARAAQ